MITNILNNSIVFISGVCKEKVTQNKKLVGIALVALAAIALLYQRLFSHALFFEKWTVIFKVASQIGLPNQNFEEISRTYSPLEFIRRLNAQISQTQKDNKLTDPKNSQDWVTWIASVSQEALSEKVFSILPSSKERSPLTLEDERIAKIQTWAFGLEPIFAFIQEQSLSWKDLLRPLQSTPRLAYTVLFHCLAPFVFQMIGREIENNLPTLFEKLQEQYTQHTKLAALVCLGMIVWLYSRMTQEKGMITNLTYNFASSYKLHKGLDLIPCYKDKLSYLLRAFGQQGSNILWFYNENTHRTLTGEIGNILGEMTATGRLDPNLLQEFPHLKKLQVVEFNVALFLTENTEREQVRESWHNTLVHLSKKDTLVVLTGLDAITHYLLPAASSRPEDEPGFSERPSYGPSCEKLLSSLIKIAIEQKRFSCLIELTEEEKIRLEDESSFYRLFSPIRAPDLEPKIIEELCIKLYTAPDLPHSFSREEMEDLFRHLKPVLATTPLASYAIMDSIQEVLRIKEGAARLQLEGDNIAKLKKLEDALEQAQAIKDELLRQVWEKRRLQRETPQSLLQSLLLMEKIIIPEIGKNIEILNQNKKTPPEDLVSHMQKKFVRLFGPCTKQEEERLKTLSDRLNSKIKGQHEAIKAICEAIYRFRKVPNLDGKPLVLFLAGPPGVGKSETATQLAFDLNFAYGLRETAVQTNERNVRRINLNRKEQGGLLGWEKIEADILGHLLQEPTAVIILEEWDKMNAEDKTCLLELLDSTKKYWQAPWSTTSINGPFVDKSCAVFVLTSNIKSEADSFAERQQAIKEGIEKSFSDRQSADAFLSRIDSLVPFVKVSPDTAQELMEEYLTQYKEMGSLSEEQMQKVRDKLQSLDISDARELQRLVQSTIFTVLAEQS